jgi:ribonucleoside-triphosphate reductase
MEPDPFAPDDKPSFSPDEFGEPEVLVRRSDEDMVLFDSHRIVEALVRETNVDQDVATHIGLEVREFIQKLGFRALSTSLIRGLVDAKLLELGLEDAHRSHTRLGVPFYDVDRILQNSIGETTSQPYGPDGTSLMLAEAIKREYAILNVFSEATANAHLVGDIHIQAIGAVDRPYSLTSSIDYVKRYGVRLPIGFASSRPARRADVLIAHIVKLSAALHGYLAGPVVWDSVNFGIAPFLTGADHRTIKQLAQVLVYEFSAPGVALGGRVIASDLHLDLEAPSHLKFRPAIGSGGETTDHTYGELEPLARSFLESLLEVYIEGDSLGRAFSTPRLILHLNRNFAQNPEHQYVLELAAELAIARGGVTIVFDRDEDDIFLRRYGVIGRRVPSTIESHALRSTQFQLVSLNLPRVGYLAAGNHVRVFEELTRLMETAAQAHLEKRVFLEKLLALGDRGPLSALTTRAGDGPLLKLSWASHAICPIGLNELCRAVLKSNFDESDESFDFAAKVLAHLNREADRLSAKHKVRFILSAEVGDITAGRLARLDRRFFETTADAVVCGDTHTDAVYYTEGVRTGATGSLSVMQRIVTEGSFHRLGLTNATTPVWIGADTPEHSAIVRLVYEAAEHSASTGLVFCPEFTTCSGCGQTSNGLHGSCPSCGSDRVDGIAYAGNRYTRISSWDPGRLAELRDRPRAVL